MLIITFTTFTVEAKSTAESIKDDIYKNERLGIQIGLPDGNWTYEDKSQGPATVILLSRENSEDFHFTIMRMPKVLGIKSASDRDEQLSSFLGDKYGKIDIKADSIDGKASSVLIYDVSPSDTLSVRNFAEILVVGDKTYILQISGPVDKWNSNFKEFKKIFEKTTFTKDDINKMRIKKVLEEGEEEDNGLEENARILHHNIKISLSPSTGKFLVSDRFRVRIIEDKVNKLEFMLSNITVDSIKLSGKNLPFSLNDYKNLAKKLVVDLDKRIDSSEVVLLSFFAHKNNYIYEVKGSLISGYNILGQVQEKSSYSSHVFYYPVDMANTATGNIRIEVPTDYMAISSGELATTDTIDENVIYNFRSDESSPKMLPFPFAAGKYVKYDTTTTSGTKIEIYTWEENSEHVKERLEKSYDIVEFYSKIFNPLPIHLPDTNRDGG